MPTVVNYKERRETFGRWLTGELAKRDWTQGDLVARLGGSDADYSKVSRWVRGERLPLADQCRLLAQALGVHEDEVLQAAGHRRMGIEPTLLEVRRVVGSARADIDRLADAIEQMARVMVPVAGHIGVPPRGERDPDTVGVLAEQLRGATDPMGLRVWVDLPGVLSGDVVIFDNAALRVPRVGDLVVVRARAQGETRYVLARWQGGGRWHPIEATDHHALAGDAEPEVVGTFVGLVAQAPR